MTIKDLAIQHYSTLEEKVTSARKAVGKPLTLTEKILYAHLYSNITPYQRGIDYANFSPDRVAMQDATAQMALLQFMNAGMDKTAVPSSVHCDHLIMAEKNAATDLAAANKNNKEVYDFLSSVCNRYGIGFWKPGAGIIHQVILENYAFPGGMMIGTDSHTPNAGGLGMVAIGVGGADAVDVMAGMAWELKMPKILGVKLTGKLNGFTAAKDIILKLAGILTVKGGTGYIVEYFGEGCQAISATGKATVCNMGAEIGATTSLFPYDNKIAAYLSLTGREAIAEAADKIQEHLRADDEVYASPNNYYDQVIEINLSELEPHINGPFTPDKAWRLSEFAQAVADNNYPVELSAGLIGSCTNSSYEDIARATSLIRQAIAKKLPIKPQLLINPGSEQVRYTIERDGLLADLEKAGAIIMSNACGPCIGQWKREGAEKEEANSIVTSFNRNFTKRNDGNPNTHAFVTSPEMAIVFAIAGRLDFNPLTDTLTNSEGQQVKLDAPSGEELPANGFAVEDNGYQAPLKNGSGVDVKVEPSSDRIQLLKPFPKWEGKDISNLSLLIKAKGKCTTDHISMAGIWLRYRGHLENISKNLLLGAVNAFNNKPNCVLNPATGVYETIVDACASAKGNGLLIVGDENYGEGSSREHAAMEPRFVGVRAVLVRSFARIHETNLKKQGLLALTFSDPADYDKIREDDRFDIVGLKEFSPNKPLQIVLKHSDNTTEQITVNHTYNQNQIEWFKAGSALNLIKQQHTK